MRIISIEKTLNAFSNFDTDVTVIGCAPYGNGHINDTFLVTGDTKRFILQSINSNVFKKPEEVMHNIALVTSFLKTQTDDERRVLNLVKTKDGNAFYKDADGRYWRLYDFVESSLSLDLPETTEDFYQSAIAFGEFQKLLNDFPVEKLYETIPDFHNTPDRYRKFLEAVEKDVCGRAASVAEEIKFVKDRADFYSVLFDNNKEGKLPLRVTHNDTKINNVLFDGETGEAKTVIDLDTVMPGLVAHDFGDAIRYAANTAAEDEKDLSLVHLDMDRFRAFTEGFLSEVKSALTPLEIRTLALGAFTMTAELAVRFLDDYIQGSPYFKVNYPEHNLVRTRCQIALARDMQKNLPIMEQMVRECVVAAHG